MKHGAICRNLCQNNPIICKEPIAVFLKTEDNATYRFIEKNDIN